MMSTPAFLSLIHICSTDAFRGADGRLGEGCGVGFASPGTLLHCGRCTGHLRERNDDRGTHLPRHSLSARGSKRMGARTLTGTVSGLSLIHIW